MPAPRTSPKLGIFALTMINVAAVFSLRSLPGMAEYGYSLIFYLTMACLCFFLPSALVSAELASGWREDGGVYLWIKEAFGPKWGFVGIFMQWVENLPWFPAVLAFAASDVAFVFDPTLAQNKVFVVVLIWVSLWVATFLNFRDMRLSSFFSSSGVITGTILPGILIIALCVDYLGSDRPVQIAFSAHTLLPNLNSPNQLMLLAAMLVSMVGMEMSAVHVNDVDNPGQSYPKAIFAACAMIIVLSVLGALAIALVVPPDSVSLSAGVAQAFQVLFEAHHMPFLTPVVCALMGYGALTMVVTWMAGPAKGMRVVAQEGFLPRSWSKTNPSGMPTNILLIQTALSSLLSLVILFMPTVSSAFMLMSALAAQLYLIMYLLMFAAAIRLRYTRPDQPRGYTIPGGKPGIWLVCGVAICTSIFVTIFGFIPPEEVSREGIEASAAYVLFLACGMALFTALPILFYYRALKRKAARAA